MEAGAIAAAAAGIGVGVLAPGLWVARRLVQDPLERVAVGLAIGRLLFATSSLGFSSTLGAGWLVVWLGVGLAAALALIRGWWQQSRHPSGEHSAWMARALAATALAAVALVFSGVGRSGTLLDGDLIFFGRDTTNDPMVYGAIARRLADVGYPLTNPFAGGTAVPGSVVPFALLAGLHALGVPILDAAYRVLPIVESLGLGVSAIALVRVLGATGPALVLAPVLLLLGGEPSRVADAVAALAGRPVVHLDTWAFFGPYLLSFNPIAPALQTWFAVLVLLARCAPDRRGAAIVAGLLVAALFEIKLFLWAPAVAALVLVAALRPPRSVATPLRLAAGVAVVGSLPSLAEKLMWALRLRGGDESGFGACIGCLPRYLADAAWGGGDLSFASFRSFRSEALLDPLWLVVTVAACAATVVVALGARLLALPELMRGMRAVEAPGPAVVLRLLALGAAVGLVLAASVSAPPHYLNAAQFAWIASYGLWPIAALTLGRWWAARRFLAVALAAVLIVPGSIDALWRLGMRAPASLIVTRAEQQLLGALAARSTHEDVVLEPSMLRDPDQPSPVPALTGRAVHLSLLSHALYLPAALREERFTQVAAVFAAADRERALEAIRASGATLVLAPASASLRFEPGPELELVVRGDAGRVYRVTGAERGE